jgi:hypothetical protein
MPHRPNPIPRFNNPQYANTTLTGSQSASSTVQNAPQGATNSSRRDLNTLPPRHRGHSFSANTPPSIPTQDGNLSNRGERALAAGHRSLPPPRLQRKQRPPRVQSILAGHDNIDGTLGTLTFGPMTNWGVGTQSVVSLPMAAVNAASSAVATSASPQPDVLLSNNPALNAPIDDLPSGFATSGIPQISIDSTPRPVNNSPAHLSFGMSASVPHSTSLPNPPTYLVSFHLFSCSLGWVRLDHTIRPDRFQLLTCFVAATRPITRRPDHRAMCTVCFGPILCVYTTEWRLCPWSSVSFSQRYPSKDRPCPEECTPTSSKPNTQPRAYSLFIFSQALAIDPNALFGSQCQCPEWPGHALPLVLHRRLGVRARYHRRK